MGIKTVLAVFCLFMEAQVNGKATYKAGVVTLPGMINPQNNLNDLLESNLQIYEKYIREAGKQKVDILVFPEATLNYYGFINKNSVREFALTIPSADEKVAPCDSKKYDKALSRICNAAKAAKTYVVVNVAERVDCKKFPNTCGGKDNVNVFNTNIVFDRNGMIVARHRKLHLFREAMMDVPKKFENEMETFTTDFGVKFFSIVCFDLIMKKPTIENNEMWKRQNKLDYTLSVIRKEEVKNIILTTMWYSKTPFLVAPQAQMGVAFANNINLLAACGQWFEKGAAGSGIYSGVNGPLQMHIIDATQPKMIVADVPTTAPQKKVRESVDEVREISGQLNKRTYNNELTAISITRYPFSKFNADLVAIKERYSVCPHQGNDFKHCCNYDVKFKAIKLDPGKAGYHYYFASYFDARQFGGAFKLGELFCAIVACKGNNPKEDCGDRFDATKTTLHNTAEFKSIKISMTIEAKGTQKLEDVLVMPSTLNVNMLPMQADQFQFSSRVEKKTKTNEITLVRNDNVLYTFGFYGRNFNSDDAP